jgi:hypothetical protein
MTRAEIAALREERAAFILEAEKSGIILSPADFGFDGGELTLDGVNVREWLEAMGVHKHNDYPHNPGQLYDCAACENNCFCDGVDECVYCQSFIFTSEVQACGE